MEQIDWERKVDGYRRLFEDADNNLKRFKHEDTNVTVRLILFTKDRNDCPEGSYKRFWMDSVDAMLKEVFLP
jgi:hypothetical protein